MISHFTFTRGDRVFEVMVQDKWTANKLEHAKVATKKAMPIFLEEDDFIKGKDTFALDFFLMKKDFKLISGKDFISRMEISKDNLRIAVETEIRRLASSARSAFFKKIPLSMKDIMVTLIGLKNAIGYLGIDFNYHEDFEKLQNTSGILFTRKRINVLLHVLQKWEDLMN